MPLSPISFADARRKMLSAGFVESTTVGSHVKFIRFARTAIVPKHREIKVGTLRSILRQAGLSVDEWESL